MALREDLLNPITGENPSGVDLRYDKLLLFDKIKEARRQDDDLAQGDWQHERKVADHKLVVKLTEEALANRSKDLQLAGWLTDALVHTQGFAGLRRGLTLCHGLIQNFWDTLYPAIEDGDPEARSAPLEWLVAAVDVPLKSVPLVNAGYSLLKYKETKLVGYESAVQNDKEKKARAKKIDEGKLPPEQFDKAFVETPKAFYATAEKELDGCLQAVDQLAQLCDENFGAASPSVGKLRVPLTEIRQCVHALLEKKRETEPDPVEAPPPETDEATSEQPGTAAAIASGAVVELTNRKQAIALAIKAAAFLRKEEPYSPAPYLMLRGLRWGELRAAADLSDATLLEAPPTELRQQVKRLALAKKWEELLETAENAMALPSSRAWLDLQRLVCQACNALGKEYAAIESAIRSELKCLLDDLPQLWDANLLDDTPVANTETRTWLRQLGDKPFVSASAAAPAEGTAEPAAEGNPAPPSAPPIAPPHWPARPPDAYELAQDALKAGRPQKAFEIMQQEINRQSSGRRRFERTLQLVQLCMAAGKDAIAQPLVDDLAAAIDGHKLDDWEDRELVAAALMTVMTVSKKIQGSASEKQKLFERICRLDPVRALGSIG
jgi:type VI secretion system protein ImpA